MTTGTCFIQKMYAPSSSLPQGKHLPFSPSSLRFKIFRLFVILSLTQLYGYNPEILVVYRVRIDLLPPMLNHFSLLNCAVSRD
jgi:hypothetical protein